MQKSLWFVRTRVGDLAGWQTAQDAQFRGCRFHSHGIVAVIFCSAKSDQWPVEHWDHSNLASFKVGVVSVFNRNLRHERFRKPCVRRRELLNNLQVLVMETRTWSSQCCSEQSCTGWITASQRWDLLVSGGQDLFKSGAPSTNWELFLNVSDQFAMSIVSSVSQTWRHHVEHPASRLEPCKICHEKARLIGKGFGTFLACF